MANPFAAKQSGMASMFESMIPGPVMEAIKQAQEQIPALVTTVKETMSRMEARQAGIDDQLEIILLKLESLRSSVDPSYVPDLGILEAFSKARGPVKRTPEPGPTLLQKQLKASLETEQEKSEPDKTGPVEDTHA